MGKVKIVSASAGSGKTYNLAYEYVRNVIENPVGYRHILAVTFTNKATEEMKQRILHKINEISQNKEAEFLNALRQDLGMDTDMIVKRAVEARGYILHDYGRFAVVTIDKFFQRIIRSFIKELGIDLNFNLELPTEPLLNRATDRLIDDLTEDPDLREWIMAFVNEKIDESKPWNVKNEIRSLGLELFKEGYKQGAGTSPDRKALKKAVDMVTRSAEIEKNRLKSIAKGILDIFSENDLHSDDFFQKDRGVAGYVKKMAEGNFVPYNTYVKKALEEQKWASPKSEKFALIQSISQSLTSELARLCREYDEGIKIMKSADLVRSNYRHFALLVDLQQKITEICREENIVHISEINEMLSELIADNDTPFIFEKAGNYFSRFMIDEFQDTSALQWKNFIPLLRNAVSESDDTPVMLVGDVKQSIYRWRGGDWSILAEKAASEFERTTCVSLQNNFRSKLNIVEFNNVLIGECVDTDNRAINSMLEQAAAEKRIGNKLVAELTDTLKKAYKDYLQTPGPREDQQGGYVTLTYYGRDETGIAVPPVIRMIETLQERGYAPRDIAILVRRNEEARSIASLLLAYKSEHPELPYRYDVITQDALTIGSAPVCRFLINCMKLAVGGNDSITVALYNEWFGQPFDMALSDADQKFFNRLRLLSPEEGFEETVMRYGLQNRTEEVPYLQALHEQIISFCNDHIADLSLFIDWWEENGKDKSMAMPSNGDAITIDTIHRSKGLGYKVVILPYCNWKMLPITHSIIWTSPQSFDREQISFPIGFQQSMSDSIFAGDYCREYVMSHIDNLNLFYVALTRAREELHLMIPDSATSSSERIDALIGRVITEENGEARIGNLVGKITEEENLRVITFGHPTHPEQSTSSVDALNIPFTTLPTGGRIGIRLDTRRYTDDGVSDRRFSPRNYGILMHRIFEQARTSVDVETAILSLRNDAVLNETEIAELRANIDRAFANPVIREWFDGTWDEIRNENDIIVPGDRLYRPDRVMIRGQEATVVDYKFGLETSPTHHKQVKDYMEILHSMGYEQVCGYIWYIGLSRLEKL